MSDRGAMAAFDLHQHLWPEPLLSALARRRTPPRLHGNVLDLGGQGSFDVDLAAHDLQARLRDLDRDEIDVAIVSLAPTLGIDLLPADEAEPLLGAYHAGILDAARQSGGRIRAFAAGRVLDSFAGVTVAAGALADLDGLSSLLTELDRRRGVLFVHPGPSVSPPGAPDWWGAVVGYTAQMQAAYAAWLSGGVQRWPDLSVVFAILAGGGPFQLERLRSRGVDPRLALRPNLYVETASYGAHALELCLNTLGVGQLLYGSDAPVIDSQPTLQAVRGFGQAVADAMCCGNPRMLFG
ncbi:MAG TPA: amidohydrolase family protein [Gaiellaceae bacterium]